MGLLDQFIDGLLDTLAESGEAQQRTALNQPAIGPDGEITTAGDVLIKTTDITEEELPTGVTTDGATVDDILDSTLSGVADTFEDIIVEEVDERAPLTPENVEEAINDAEGRAVAEAVAVLLGTVGAEAASAGQIESHQFIASQFLTFLAFEDIFGRRTTATLQEGADPPLKQEVHSRFRSKQADFADYSEANLRAKWAGGNIPTRTDDIPDAVFDLFADEDFGWLGDPDTYGTIPDQQGIYEWVALAHLEPEELFEELPQKGVIPSRASTEQILHTAGLPEDIKEGYFELWRNLPKSQDLIQEGIRLEEPIRAIDQAVFESRLSPSQAARLVRADVEAYISVAGADGSPQTLERTPQETVGVVMEELRARWHLLDSIPADAPTRGQIERWYRNGVINGRQFIQLNEQFGILPTFGADMLIDNAIRKGGDSVAQQFILDRISATDAKFQLGLIGYNADETARILAGADPDNVIQDRFAALQEDAQLPVSLAIEIGDARSAQLRAVGIDSLAALAQSDIEDITAVTGMTDTEAQQAIESAQRILEQGS